jgi:hypothetical protein
VRPERVRAYDVLQKLQTKFRAFIQLEPILWEHEAMRATATFQAQILPPSKADIVVCILWVRIGMRLPSDYRRPDGTVPTGTEWEFEDAYSAYQLRGTPDLLVYRKTAAPTITVSSDEQLTEWQAQKKALDLFLNNWSRDHEGAFKAAFNSFATDEEFASKLEQHLEKIINERLQAEAGAAPDKQKITWFEGSPFLGLRAFQPEHAPIFFGREVATKEIVDRLKTQAAAGRVFLMLLGMSGCGKSSLARAGVIPSILRPGETDIPCWKYTTLRPSDSAAGLLLSLANALMRPEALPEIEGLGYTAESLASLFKDAPIHSIPLFQAALQQSGRAFSQRQLRSTDCDARLLLLVDQFEELFTMERFRPEVDQFIATIAALSQSGLVWVLITMRSDMYAHCTESGTLLRLKGEDGQYDVTVPGFAEIAQMVRMPAAASGLHYEVDPQSGQKLDDAILEEAWKNPEALPLLEFTLDELYKVRTESNVLTWKSYRELGGMAGAISKRAEAEYELLSDQAKDAVPFVFARLVNLEHDKASAAFALAADICQIGGAKEVISRFVAANLFVTNATAKGETVVSLSHEALLDSWPRLRDWIASNREFLRVKQRLAKAAQLWIDAGKDTDYLLPAGKPLAEAEDALIKRRKELAPQEVALAETSRAAARSRRRRKMYVVGGLTLSILAIISVAAVVLFFKERQSRRSLDAATAAISGLVDAFQILQPVAKLDQVQTLVDQARNAIDRLSGVTNDPRLINERARTFVIIAGIDLVRGNIYKMREDATQAVSLLNKIADGGDVEARYERANSQRLIGMTYYQTNNKGDKEMAKNHFELGISELRNLLATHPTDSQAWQWERTLADTDQELGGVLLDEFNLSARARVACDEAYKIRVKLKDEGHRGSEMDHDLAWAANKLGDVEERMGHDDEALKWFQTAQKGLLALGNSRVLWPYDLALVDNNIGLVFMRKTDYAQALENFEIAENLILKAIDSDPKNNIWQAILGWTYDNWGQSLVRWAVQTKDRARLTQARTMLGKALDVRTQVASDAPDTALNKLGVINARANIAIVDATAHDWKNEFTPAAQLYAEAADLIADTYVIHMKQYARSDRLLRIVEMRRNSASAYKKSGDAANARIQLAKALKFLSDYAAELDPKIYEDTRKQLEEDSDAIKNKS